MGSFSESCSRSNKLQRNGRELWVVALCQWRWLHTNRSHFSKVEMSIQCVNMSLVYVGRFDLCSEEGIWIIGLSDSNGVWSTFRLTLDDPDPICISSCIFSLNENAILEEEMPQKPWSAFEFIHHVTKEIAWCEEGGLDIRQCSIPQVKPQPILKSYCHDGAYFNSTTDDRSHPLQM